MKRNIYILVIILIAISIVIYLNIIKSSEDNYRENLDYYIDNSYKIFTSNEIYQAIELLNKEIADDPKNEHYLLVRGDYWAKIDETNNALKDFNKVLKLNSYSVDGYLTRANMFLKYDNTDEAFKNISSALKVDKDYFLSYSYAGFAYFLRNDLTNALANFNVAIDKNPNHSYSYLYKGYIYQTLGKVNLAKVNFEQALKYESTPKIMNDIAWLYLTEKGFKNTDRAFALAEKAVSLERRPQYLDTLACAYAEKGDFNKAIGLEKEAYNLSTNIYYKEIMDIFENKLTYLDWKEKNPDLEKKLKNIH